MKSAAGKSLNRLRLILLSCLVSAGCGTPCLKAQVTHPGPLAQKPPLGWNSFDSYGVYLYQEAAMANLEAFAEKLAPHGYEYFVIDAGWFGEFKLREGTIYPAEKHAQNMNFNKYGLLLPSHTYFPDGLQPIIDRCHALGLKFGVHLMRGIPREAVKLKLPVKGTSFYANDIADTTSICTWCPQNYGVDMNRQGAQEFYNSVINHLAAWGVDFIKYDDITQYPKEIEAVQNAIAQCGRPIVLSLSAGKPSTKSNLPVYRRANLLRVTADIWDTQSSIDQTFEAWRKWNGENSEGFWIDMDMIPFGQLLKMSPKPRTQAPGKDNQEPAAVAYAGKGYNRQSNFTKDQMLTFITQRALSASPLMMGGDLPTLDQFSLELITNFDMLECNQNGVMGKLVFEAKGIEIWLTPEKGTADGWIGIFNRNNKLNTSAFSVKDFGLDPANSYIFRDIWNKSILVPGDKYEIGPNGVIFLKYLKQ